MNFFILVVASANDHMRDFVMKTRQFGLGRRTNKLSVSTEASWLYIKPWLQHEPAHSIFPHDMDHQTKVDRVPHTFMGHGLGSCSGSARTASLAQSIAKTGP